MVIVIAAQSKAKKKVTAIKKNKINNCHCIITLINMNLNFERLKLEWWRTKHGDEEKLSAIFRGNMHICNECSLQL